VNLINKYEGSIRQGLHLEHTKENTNLTMLNDNFFRNKELWDYASK